MPLVPDSFRGMKHGIDRLVPEFRQLSKTWAKSDIERRSFQRAGDTKSLCRTVRNEVRSVVGWIMGHERFSILPTQKDSSLTEGCVCCSRDEKTPHEHDERAQIS